MPDDYESVMIEGNYLYKITADVISRTGEVGSGTLFLPVDHRSVALGINGLSNEVALEKREAIKVMAINYSAQELSLQATCVVYALNERGRKSHEVCRRTVETNTFFVPDELFTLAPGRYAW